jgi:hypothetical protein
MIGPVIGLVVTMVAGVMLGVVKDVRSAGLLAVPFVFAYAIGSGIDKLMKRPRPPRVHDVDKR